MAEPNKAKIQEILASNLDPAEKLRLIVEEQRIVDKENVREAVEMLTPEEREELNRRAHEGEVVIPGGTGGKSLEAQIHLAEGRAKGGKHRAQQLGKEGYQEMGKKGGLSSSGESPEEKGVPIDESKFRTKS
ncbi:unnamed protein product [Sphagnum compactum]